VARIGIRTNTIHHIHSKLGIGPVIEIHGLSPYVSPNDTQVYGSCRPASVDYFSSSSPSVSTLFRAGWSPTGCHWTATKPKSCSARQVDVSISCHPTHCQSTALLLTHRSPLAFWISILILFCWYGPLFNVQFHGALPCYVNSGRFVARCRLTCFSFQTLIVSLMLTRLDFRNSMLAGLPVYLVRRLPNDCSGADMQVWWCLFAWTIDTGCTPYKLENQHPIRYGLPIPIGIWRLLG